jgi:hypothetical protein
VPTRLIPDPDAALRDIAAVFTGLASFAADERTHHGGWAPAAGSPIATELESAGRFTAGWGDPVELCFGMAVAHLLAAEDALRAQARLLQNPPTALAHLALARVTIEASGQAWHLLDPDIDVDTRVAQWSTHRLHELWEVRKLGEPYATELSVDADIDAIVADARDVGLAVTVPEGRGAPYVGKPRLGSVDLMRRQFKAEGMLEVGVDLYRSFSGAVHGHSDAVGRSSVRAADNGAQLTLLPENLTLPAMGACIGYGSALERLLTYVGWPTDGLATHLSEAAETVNRWEQATRGADSGKGQTVS